MKKYFLLFFLLSTSLAILAQVNYTANDQVTPYTGLFRPGINFDYYPPYTSIELANIAAGNPSLGLNGIGAKTSRPALYEKFTQTWGLNFHVNNFQHFQDVGMKDLTMIVGFPAEWHRDQTIYCDGNDPYHVYCGNDPYTTNCQSTMFANLYTPIWDGGANGTPYNDDNYLAAYMYELVTLYKDDVKFWEIWNEPGFDHSYVQGWQPPGGPGNWWDNDPSPCVNHFHAPIEHFVRTLRICYDVVKTVDPDAYVTLAGVGFESFLDAVLRNTDNPVDGSVTPEYPLGGGAYFDCMGFHTYPDIDGSVREWDSNTNQWVYHRNSDAAAQGVIKRKNTYQNRLAVYGYDGVTHPKKEWIITEINSPRVKFGAQSMASDESQVNYITKAVVNAMKIDVRQMHPYQLADRKTVADATGEFDLLGMYLNFTGTQPYDNLTKTNEGITYKTTSDVLFGTKYDAAKTAAMNLPNNLDGGAFYDVANNRYKYILWAKTTLDLSEAASGTYSFPASFGISTLSKREWNYSETNNAVDISPNNIQLTGRPIYLLDGSDPGNGNITLTCPPTLNLSLPQGASTVVGVWNPPTAISTCPLDNTVTVNQTGGMPSGSDFWMGSHTITYSAFDQCGNTASCSFEVVVSAGGSSTVSMTCPPDVNVTTSNGATTAVASWATPTATTNCGTSANTTVTQTTGLPSGSNFTVGTHPITYQATDQCGSSATCSFSVIVTQGVATSCGEEVGYTKIGEQNNHGYYLSNTSMNWNDAQAAAQQSNGYLVAINSAQENALVQAGVTDIVLIGLNDAQTEGNLVWANNDPVTYTNYNTACTWCNANGNDFDYATLLPWDGTWAFENQWVSRPFVMEKTCSGSSGDLTLTNCPADITRTLGAGVTEIPVNWSMPTATTTCSSGNNITLTQTAGANSGSNFSAGTYTITYLATDQCGNSATCTFTVTIVPYSGGGGCGPKAGFTLLGEFNGHGYYLSNASTPWDEAKTLAENAGGYLATMNTQAENDFVKSVLGSKMAFIGFNDATTEGIGEWANGEAVTLDLSYANSSTNDYAVMNFWAGTWQMVSQGVYKPFIMEADCGSIGQLVINCRNDISVTIPPGSVGTTVSWAAPSAVTTCSNQQVTVTQTGGPTSGSNLAAGSYNVTYEATDLCGNTATCGFTITVTGGASNCNDLPGYTLLGSYGGHGYYLSNDEANWNQAKTLAENAGGYLASMNTQAENDYLMSMLGNNMVFIGFNDATTEGTGQWANGDAVTLDLSYGNSPEADYAIMNFWAGTWEMANMWVAKKYVMEMNCGASQPAPYQYVPLPIIGTKLMSMYPNPADDIITARILSEKEATVQFLIFNAQGQAQSTTKADLEKGVNEIDFEIQDLEPGMYFLKTTGQDANQVIRFVKMD